MLQTSDKTCGNIAFSDYYKFWLESIDSYSDTNTQVIIVGTHADKLSKQVSIKNC